MPPKRKAAPKNKAEAVEDEEQVEVVDVPTKKSKSAPKKKAEPQVDEEEQAEVADAPTKKGKQSAATPLAVDSVAVVATGSLADLLVEPKWKAVLAAEFNKPYWAALEKFVEAEYRSATIFPPRHQIFAAFNSTPLDDVRVVILGQDPYFNPGQGNGLCFSVQRGVKCPPSLNRLYKVLAATIPSFKTPKHGDLSEWASRGVLMLNATLTVRSGQANSHAKSGWQNFTNAAIEYLAKQRSGICFVLWGLWAQKCGKFIDDKKHLVINDPHPSPMSGSAFLETKPFTTINTYLKANGFAEIDWSISP